MNTKILFGLLFIIFPISCISQDSNIVYDHDQSKWFISESIYRGFKINNTVLLTSLRSDSEPWTLLNDGFPNTYSAKLDTSFFGLERTDDLNGLKLYYSDYENPGALTASRLELTTSSFFLTSERLELRVGSSIENIVPNDLLKSSSQANFLEIFIQSNNTYLDAPFIVVLFDSDTRLIKEIKVIFWRT